MSSPATSPPSKRMFGLERSSTTFDMYWRTSSQPSWSGLDEDEELLRRAAVWRPSALPAPKPGQRRHVLVNGRVRPCRAGWTYAAKPFHLIFITSLPEPTRKRPARLCPAPHARINGSRPQLSARGEDDQQPLCDLSRSRGRRGRPTWTARERGYGRRRQISCAHSKSRRYSVVAVATTVRSGWSAGNDSSRRHTRHR